MVTEPIDAPYIGIPIQITKWGQYEGELETVPMASWTSASEAGRAMGARQAVPVEPGHTLVFSVNDDFPYATESFQVLVGQASKLSTSLLALPPTPTRAGQTALAVLVEDMDANRDPLLVETVRAHVWSHRTGELEDCLLVETAAASGEFSGVVALETAGARAEGGADKDGVLRVLPEDLVNVSYTDLVPARSYELTRAISFVAVLHMSGTVHMGRCMFAANRPLTITVLDADLNRDRRVADRVGAGVAWLQALASSDVEALELHETGPTSNVFTAQVEASLLRGNPPPSAHKSQATRSQVSNNGH
jgi:hypothetical protein